jgi:tRNA splicing ligase|nr:MAG TPA: FAM163 family [Caudoviricetes sp.]
MKTLKGTALSMIGLVVAIAAVGCGDTIQGCQTTAQMFGWVIVSCGLLATSIVLCVLAVSTEEEERSESERQRIKRIAHHTNEWNTNEWNTNEWRDAR